MLRRGGHDGGGMGSYIQAAGSAAVIPAPQSYHRNGCCTPTTVNALGRSSYPALSSSSRSAPLSRLEELEGLLFMQQHYRHLFPGATGYDSATVECGDTTAQKASPVALDRPPGAPSSHLVHQYAYPTPSAAGAAYRCLNAPTVECRTAAPTNVWTVNEPFGVQQDSAYRSSPSSQGPVIANDATTEAERYIAKLEEEVQTLTTEVLTKEACIVRIASTKDSLALQLRERQQRSECAEQEGAIRQVLNSTFVRTISLQRKIEERSRVMELQTQISLLKQELKVSETLLATSRESHHSAAVHQQRRDGENALAHSVTATVRSVFQEECGRLAQLVSETSSKAQAVSSATAADGPSPAQAAAQAMPTVSPMAPSGVSSVSAGDITRGDATVSSMSAADTAHLICLVSRAWCHAETLLNGYNEELERRVELSSSESNLVRLIGEKQMALTWAALYQEKKDDVKHLSEKISELRGELRAVKRSSENVIGRDTRGGSKGGFSATAHDYEAYAAPFVPSTSQQAVPGAQQRSGSELTHVKRRVTTAKKPIGELRDEARRLGVLPAMHHVPLATSPSSSMQSSAVTSVAEVRLALPAHGAPTAATAQEQNESSTAREAPLAAAPTLPRSLSLLSPLVLSAEVKRKPHSSSSSSSSSSLARGSPRGVELAKGQRSFQPAELPRATSLSSASAAQAQGTTASRQRSVVRRPVDSQSSASSSTSSLSRADAQSVTPQAKTEAAAETVVSRKALIKAIRHSFDDDDDRVHGGGSGFEGTAAAAEVGGDGGTARGAKRSIPTTASARAVQPAAGAHPSTHKEEKSDSSTSSLTLSITSLSFTPPKRKKGPTHHDPIVKAVQPSRVSTSAATPKRSLPKKSSFDDDDDDVSGGSDLHRCRPVAQGSTKANSSGRAASPMSTGSQSYGRSASAASAKISAQPAGVSTGSASSPTMTTRNTNTNTAALSGAKSQGTSAPVPQPATRQKKLMLPTW